MYQLVCKHKIRNTIYITLYPKILLVRPRETSINTVMVVHHTSNCIKSKSINLKFLYVVSKIAEKKSDYFVFTIVKYHTIPSTMIAFWARVWVAVICAVKSINSIEDIIWSMWMNYINYNSNSKFMCSVNKLFELVRSTLTWRGSEIACYMISKRTIICMLLNSHYLNTVIAIS